MVGEERSNKRGDILVSMLYDLFNVDVCIAHPDMATMRAKATKEAAPDGAALAVLDKATMNEYLKEGTQVIRL